MGNRPSVTIATESSDPASAFRDLIDLLVWCMSLIGSLPVLLALSRSAVFGWSWGISLQVAAWSMIVLLLPFRRRLSFRQRTYGFLGLLMLYGAAGVMTWGLNGQGLLLLFACVIMATMVDGPPAGLAITILSLVIGGIAGMGYVAGWLNMGPDAQTYIYSVLDWANGLTTAAVLMLAAVWSMGRLKSSWQGIMQALRQREEEYASILRFTPDVIYRLDNDHCITFISDAVKRYGFEPADMLGRPLLDFVHPEDQTAVARRLQERRTGPRRTQNMEVRLFGQHSSAEGKSTGSNHDGTQPVFLISAEGLYPSGKVRSFYLQGTQGVARDITERKRAEKALMESETFFRDLAANVPGVVYQFYARSNNEYGVYYVSESSKDIFDVSGELEHYFQQFAERLMPEQRAAFLASIEQAVATVSPWAFEGEFLRPDGETIWFRGLSQPQDRGNEIVFNGILLDITHQKRIEAALQQSEEKYRLLAENIHDIIWSMDLNFQFTYISPAVEKILGWTAEDIQSIGLDGIMPENTLRQFRNAFTNSYTDSIARNDFSRALTLEQTLWHKQGRKVWMENTAAFLCNDDGQPYGILGVTRDISQRHQAQLEKAELQQKLERARKMEALGLLAGGVAHDLNNVLAGIVSYPSLMLMKVPPDSPLRENLKRMKASGEKASEIVQDLLTLARRGVSSQEVLNVNQVIREHLKSAEYLHLRSEHPGVQVVTELAPDLLSIEGSPLHLKKALMNLVANAFEAQPGGGSITISTGNRYVDRPLKGYEDIEQGEFVVLQIADQGPGMEANEIERIFEPFYTRKQMGRSGTGLGMAVVWGTIQDHQGYIHINSGPGQGTRFDLYFPVTRRVESKPHSPRPNANLEGQGQKILVVDDDPEQLVIAVEILTSLNYRVDTAPSGEAVLDYLQTQGVDLLVLDMIMPGGLDGLETYGAVLDRHPHQKALVVSGFAETDRVQEIQRIGAAGFVRKPYTVKTVALAVQAALADTDKG